MRYKFEDLEVWQISLDLGDSIYEIAAILPDAERFNLNSQIIRACTSISLNIAEGSTSQSDGEQARFIGYSIRSLIEVIACLRIIVHRDYQINEKLLNQTEVLCDRLFIKLQAFRNALK